MNTTNHEITATAGGGELPQMILRKTRLKLYLHIAQCYKNYAYALIKRSAYTIIFHKAKIQKYDKRATECYENLQLAIAGLKAFKALYPQSKAWIQSAAFKEKYIDTNHLYPPLLNPKDIDYTKISAQLAWELNLPLPQNYEYIYITSGSSASEASMYFFDECNVCFNRPGYDSKKAFYYAYEFLSGDTQGRKKGLFFYTGEVSHYPNAEHLVASIHKKVPVFYIARNPIGKIKHMLNHIEGVDVTQIRAKKRLNTDYAEFFPKLTYFGGTSKPSFEVFKNLNDTNWLANTTLNTTSALEALADKASFIHCIEFSDMKFDKAFNTYCDLSSVLGFDKPKDKALFTNKCCPTTSTTTFLPFDICANADDISDLALDSALQGKQNLDSDSKESYIVSATAQHLLPMLTGKFMATGYVDRNAKKLSLTDLIDITDEIAPNLVIDDTKILVMAQSGIKENEVLYNATKDYVKGLLEYYKAKVKLYKDEQFSEQDVLEFFKANKQSRIFIKNILDKELKHIKEHYPHFIEKWDSYNEFEKMCAELDGIDSSKGGA